MKRILLVFLSLLIGSFASAETAKSTRLDSPYTKEKVDDLARALCKSINVGSDKVCKKVTGSYVDDQTAQEKDIYRTVVAQCFAEGVLVQHSRACLQKAQAQKPLWPKGATERLNLCNNKFNDFGPIVKDVDSESLECKKKMLECEAEFPSLLKGIHEHKENIAKLKSPEGLGLKEAQAKKNWKTSTLRDVKNVNAARAQDCVEKTYHLISKIPKNESDLEKLEAANVILQQLQIDFPTAVAETAGGSR